MKKLIYLALSLLLVLSSASFLFLYYTQDFKEELLFKNTINYGSINFTIAERYGGQVVNFAEARIGELNLENKGYFTEVYHLPFLKACTNNSQRPIEIGILYDFGDSYRSVYGQGSNRLDVSVGEKKNISIYAGIGYSSQHSYPISEYSTSDFNKDNVKSILIFRIPEKEMNPIADYPENYARQSCSGLIATAQPLTTITIAS